MFVFMPVLNFSKCKTFIPGPQNILYWKKVINAVSLQIVHNLLSSGSDLSYLSLVLVAGNWMWQGKAEAILSAVTLQKPLKWHAEMGVLAWYTAVQRWDPLPNDRTFGLVVEAWTDMPKVMGLRLSTVHHLASEVLVHMHAYTQQHRVVWHYGFSGQWGGLPDLGLACWCKYPYPEEKLEECSALLAPKPNIRFSGGWLDWWAGGRRFETLQNHRNTQGTSLNLELSS